MRCQSCAIARKIDRILELLEGGAAASPTRDGKDLDLTLQGIDLEARLKFASTPEEMRAIIQDHNRRVREARRPSRGRRRK